VTIPLDLGSGRTGVVLDLSADGLYISVRGHEQPSGPVHFRLAMPHLRMSVVAHGRVVRVDTLAHETRVAVSFTDVVILLAA